VRKKIEGQYFEWDEEKEKVNVKKHKVDFTTAARVFSDPHYIEMPDDMHSNDETRYNIIGMVNKLLFVVCTDREDATRIISARKADAEERRLYNGNRA